MAGQMLLLADLPAIESFQPLGSRLLRSAQRQRVRPRPEEQSSPEACEAMSRILLIDDDEDFRRVIIKFLGPQGFELLVAPDGKAGLSLAAETPPDLIVCDLSMPVMDGYEVLAALRRDPGLADIPLIFLTGQSEPSQVRQGMNLGADDYLTKPVNLADLLGAIKVRLSRRQSQRQRQEKQLERAMQLFGGTGPELDGEAVDSGLKPVSPERLKTALVPVRQRPAAKPAAAAALNSGLSVSFLVKTLTEKRLVKVEEIERIVAYSEYSWVYWLGNKKGALLRKSLKQWLLELPGEQFIRVHRQAIVNLNCMERIEKLPNGRMQIHLRDTAEPILVSLRLAPVLNRRLNGPRA